MDILFFQLYSPVLQLYIPTLSSASQARGIIFQPFSIITNYLLKFLYNHLNAVYVMVVLDAKRFDSVVWSSTSTSQLAQACWDVY